MFTDEETEGQEVECLVRVSHLGPPLSACPKSVLPTTTCCPDQKLALILRKCWCSLDTFLTFPTSNGATHVVSVPLNPFSKSD